MKNRLLTCIKATILGLSLVLAGTSAGYSESPPAIFPHFEEDTFVRVPALEFTIANIELERFTAIIPFDTGRSERAFSQVRTSLNYDDGMVWLTFKYGKNRSLLSQLKNLRITKRVKSTYRLASPSRYRLTRSPRLKEFTFATNERQIPWPKARPAIPSSASSEQPMSEAAPGDLTVDRLYQGR